MTVVSHIQDAINTFTSIGTLNGCRPTSAAKADLFSVDIQSPLVDNDKQKIFQTVVAKLIFIATQTRMDILPALLFLCTHQGKATAEDWQKLRRLMQYLDDTKMIPHNIGADSLLRFHTFVDIAYAVHDNIKSHTGCVLSLGCGAIYAKSGRQSLNVKSSTEGEILGTSDSHGHPIWTTHFLESQEYTISE